MSNNSYINNQTDEKTLTLWLQKYISAIQNGDKNLKKELYNMYPKFNHKLQNYLCPLSKIQDIDSIKFLIENNIPKTYCNYNDEIDKFAHDENIRDAINDSIEILLDLGNYEIIELVLKLYIIKDVQIIYYNYKNITLQFIMLLHKYTNLHSNNYKDNDEEWYTDALYEAINNNNFEIANYLLINTHTKLQDLFRNINITRGVTNIIVFNNLLDMYPNFYIKNHKILEQIAKLENLEIMIRYMKKFSQYLEWKLFPYKMLNVVIDLLKLKPKIFLNVIQCVFNREYFDNIEMKTYFKKMCEIACKNDDLKFLQYYIFDKKFSSDKSKIKFFTCLFKIACRNGNLDIAKYLKKIFPELDHKCDDMYCFDYTTRDIYEWLILDCPIQQIKAST